MAVTGPEQDAAEEVSRETIVVTPEEALRIAVELHQSGNRDGAERIYRGILEREPDNAVALHFLGVARHQAGDEAEALASLRRALQLTPDDPGLLNNYGNVLIETGSPREAIPIYRRVAELQPDNPQPFNNAGVLLRAIGAPDLAEEAFQKAIELAPTDPNAYHNLGNLLIGVGRAREAIAYGLKAVTLMPDRVERGILGAAYAILGQYDDARAMYRKWLEADPDNPVPAHYLAALGDAPPERASDGYIESTFDDFASSFDSKLASLEYLAPQIVADALIAGLGGRTGLDILDAGCGTGLCGPLLRPIARQLSGIDLSGKMLSRAKARNVYDRLRRVEIMAFLGETRETFDAIVSADTLCYFGQIGGFAERAARILAPDGILVATFEAADDPEIFEITHTGRYRHGRDYLERTMVEAGLTVLALDPAVLRTEQARPVQGWVITARR